MPSGSYSENSYENAIIVAYSRPIAIKMYECFLRKRPQWKEEGKIQVVMTEGNQDPEAWREIIGTKKDRIAGAVEFKKVDSKFKCSSPIGRRRRKSFSITPT